MNDKQFEHIIKNKLSGFQSQETSDWELFLEKKAIAEAATSADPFDDQVKESLEGYETATPPQWEAFLNFRDTRRPDSLEDKGFDKQIKAGVATAVAATASQWSAFLQHKATAPSDLDQNFDSDLAAKLESHETTTEPQWEAFQNFQTKYHDSLADDNFDARIQDELDGYETVSEPNWQAYLDHSFDSQIDTKVGEYETTTQPQWDKFLKKKRENDGIVTDSAFDKSILGRLGQKKVRYNSEHWLLLKARLQKIAYFRKQIFSYKSMEMLFVALLLFTIGNHFHLIELPEEPIKMAKAEPVIETTINPGLAQTETNSEEAQLNTKTLEEQKTSATKQSQSSNNSSVKKTVLTETQTALVNSNSSEDPRTISSNSSIDRSTASTTANRESSETVSVTDRTIVQIDRSEVAGLSMLSLLDTDLLNTGRTLPDTEPVRYINPRIKKKYKDEGHWLHIVNAMDNSYITTPANLELGLLEKTHEKYGYSAELLYGRAYKRFEFELGFGYSFVNYGPYDSGKLTYTTSNGTVRSTTFEKFRIDFVSIPVNFKYHVVANGRWSVYGGLGISNDFIAKTNYSINDQVEFPGPFPGPGVPDQEDLPFFYEREFTEGIFGGAPELPVFVDYKTKNNNYLLRGTLSIGAERNISDNFAAYIRTTYYHTLYNDQIGPYNDRIDKMNFGMGFKVRLGELMDN